MSFASLANLHNKSVNQASMNERKIPFFSCILAYLRDDRLSPSISSHLFWLLKKEDGEKEEGLGIDSFSLLCRSTSLAVDCINKLRGRCYGNIGRQGSFRFIFNLQFIFNLTGGILYHQITIFVVNGFENCSFFVSRGGWFGVRRVTKKW